DYLAPPARAVLRAVLKTADRQRPPVLVGGAVRDALGGGGRGMRPIADLDVAVPSGALDLARRVADRLGGAFVPLDPERGAARVVTRGAWLDVTGWRGRAAARGTAARARRGARRHAGRVARRDRLAGEHARRRPGSSRLHRECPGGSPGRAPETW